MVLHVDFLTITVSADDWNMFWMALKRFFDGFWFYFLIWCGILFRFRCARQGTSNIMWQQSRLRVGFGAGMHRAVHQFRVVEGARGQVCHSLRR